MTERKETTEIEKTVRIKISLGPAGWLVLIAILGLLLAAILSGCRVPMMRPYEGPRDIIMPEARCADRMT